MAKLYVIERRTVLADRTDVVWYAGGWGTSIVRWDPDREQAEKLPFAHACEQVRRFEDAARAFNDYHRLYKRHEVR
jgi:hypothetical protein